MRIRRAEAAGFKAGDIILEAGGKAVGAGDDVTRATILNAGEAVTYRVKRDDEFLVLQATPKEAVERNEQLKVTEKGGTHRHPAWTARHINQAAQSG